MLGGRGGDEAGGGRDNGDYAGGGGGFGGGRANPGSGPREDFSADLDDEIPF